MPTRRDDDGDIQWGDLIVAVDGQPVESVEELLTAIEKHAVGDAVKLTIVRGLGSGRSRSLEVSVTLAAERGVSRQVARLTATHCPLPRAAAGRCGAARRAIEAARR